jgi:hypothetical protein
MTASEKWDMCSRVSAYILTWFRMKHDYELPLELIYNFFKVKKCIILYVNLICSNFKTDWKLGYYLILNILGY